MRPLPFLGRDITEPKEFGDNTARLIDEEVRSCLANAERRARSVLDSHRAQLDSLIGALLERETLTRTDLEALFSHS